MCQRGGRGGWRPSGAIRGRPSRASPHSYNQILTQTGGTLIPLCVRPNQDPVDDVPLFGGVPREPVDHRGRVFAP